MSSSPFGRPGARHPGVNPPLTQSAAPARTPASRRAGGIALLAAVAGLLLAMTAAGSPASAAAYRYWSYWQGANGTWVAAQTGPGEHELVDQDVQGWRFGITTDAPAQVPDNVPDFAALCPDLAAAPAGQIRVAVVVDSGYAAHAPTGETPPADKVSCVSLSEGSTGNQALAAAGQVTDKNGLVCSIDGYPTSECGAPVSDGDAAAAASAAATETPNPAVIQPGASAAPADSGSGHGPRVLISGVILVMVAVAALLVTRRRRSATDD